MKNKLFFVSYTLIIFALGSLVTYIAMTKQQMDNLLKVQKQSSLPPHSANSTQQHAHTLTTPSYETMADNELKQPTPNLAGTQTPTLNDYTEEQAQAILEGMPDYVLGQYVDRFLSKDAKDVIDDKRQFAKRAIEELYKKNDTTPLVGDIKLSLTPTMPNHSLDTSTLQKGAKLYAHLDTHGKVPASPFVFIKWVNNDTGQVLLFEKKNILADSQQNWVSFQPYDGWQTGSYDIRFYQFTSQLQPIAQLTYQVYEVSQ